MDNHELNRLKDTLARRPLTPQESDRVSRHLTDQPGVRADWEAESNLTRLLANSVTSRWPPISLRESCRPSRPPRRVVRVISGVGLVSAVRPSSSRAWRSVG